MKKTEHLIQNPDMDDFQREEQCRNVIKHIRRAILMRLAVVALMIIALIRTGVNAWLIGLMLLVTVVTFSALPPLVKELKDRRAELKKLLDEET